MASSIKMTGDLMDQLKAINTMAMSTSSSAEGRIGMIGGHVVKFNTHWHERVFGAWKDQNMINSCNALRTTLADLSYKAMLSAFDGNKTSDDFKKALEGILKDLGVTMSENEDKVKFETSEKRLLDRKIVAKAISGLSDTCIRARFDRLKEGMKTRRNLGTLYRNCDLTVGQGKLLYHVSENKDTSFASAFGKLDHDAAKKRVKAAFNGKPHTVIFSEGECAKLASELRKYAPDIKSSYNQIKLDMVGNKRMIVLDNGKEKQTFDGEDERKDVDGKDVGDRVLSALEEFLKSSSEEVVKRVLPLCHQAKSTYAGISTPDDPRLPTVTGFAFDGNLEKSKSESDKVTLSALEDGKVRVEIVGEKLASNFVWARIPTPEDCSRFNNYGVNLKDKQLDLSYKTVFEISGTSSEDLQVVCTEASITYTIPKDSTVIDD